MTMFLSGSSPPDHPAHAVDDTGCQSSLMNSRLLKVKRSDLIPIRMHMKARNLSTYWGDTTAYVRGKTVMGTPSRSPRFAMSQQTKTIFTYQRMPALAWVSSPRTSNKLEKQPQNAAR